MYFYRKVKNNKTSIRYVRMWRLITCSKNQLLSHLNIIFFCHFILSSRLWRNLYDVTQTFYDVVCRHVKDHSSLQRPSLQAWHSSELCWFLGLPTRRSIRSGGRTKP